MADPARLGRARPRSIARESSRSAIACLRAIGAGFSAVSVLPIEDDFLRFYRLDP